MTDPSKSTDPSLIKPTGLSIMPATSSSKPGSLSKSKPTTVTPLCIEPPADNAPNSEKKAYAWTLILNEDEDRVHDNPDYHRNILLNYYGRDPTDVMHMLPNAMRW